jgi:hypothetical protein
VSEPAFLTLDEVLGIHADPIRVYGDAGGLRDLALPEASFDDEDPHPSGRRGKGPGRSRATLRGSLRLWDDDLQSPLLDKRPRRSHCLFPGTSAAGGRSMLCVGRVARMILSFSLALAVAPASAELPDNATLLGELGISADEIAQVQAGQFARIDLKAASDRELVAGFAFQVPVTPDELVADAKRDLLDQVSPGMIAHGSVSGAGTLADFQKLTLQPDAAARANAYVTATPGGALNLSTAEIAAFAQLGASASVASVEQQVRSALLARLQAYKTQGLAGIAPYARSNGERSPGEELRTATVASKVLQARAPAAYQAALDYPQAKPPGTEEAFRWSHFEAHDVPTIALTHVMLIPDGQAWITVQRQFYVSTGFNVEQAIAAFLPTQSGTIVLYANRTSTDQITGFGGGAKRSIGSRVLESQLQSMFEKARTKVQ